MSSTLTTLDNLMKNVYLPGLPSWVNTQRPLFGRLEKVTNKKAFKGRQYIFAGKDANPQGVGAIAEGETLPAGGNTSVQNMTLAMKYYYGVARLSAQVMDAADGADGSFEKSVKVELDGVRDQIEEDLAVDGIYGDGSGARGQVNSYSGTTLTMLDQPTVGQFGARLIRKNMLLSSYSAKSGGSQGADAKQVSAVPSTTTATVPSSAGFNANDYIFRAVQPTGSGIDPRNKSMMGLGGIVDDGTRVSTFQNLARGTVTALKANRLGNSGTLRAWSPELMDQGAMEAWNNGGGGYPTAVYSPLQIQQRAAAAIRADQRYDMSVSDLEGGYKAVNWRFPGGNVPWFVDRFCIPNELHFVRESDLFMAIQQELHEVNDDGRLWRYTDRSDQLECWLRTWRNIGATACNNSTAVVDVSHTL